MKRELGLETKGLIGSAAGQLDVAHVGRGGQGMATGANKNQCLMGCGTLKNIL